jgi:cytochrome b6-f complex iron-sulfur subunit
MAKKQSTADIIARLRAEKNDAGGAEAPASPAAEQAAAPEAPADQPAAEASAPAADTPPATAKPPAAAKPAAGGKPKSTKDILAALRAEGAGGSKAAAPAAAKPASPTPAGKQPAKPAAAATATATGGPRPSVQEMLRAAREGRPVEEPAAAKPAARPQPKVPAAARKARQAEAAEPQPSRRNFVARMLTAPFVLAWIMFGLASTAFGLGLARFMMPNVLVAAPSRFKIGPPSDYPPDMVSEKFKAQFGIWVVNTVYNGQRQIYALVSVCTHLGCTPNWLLGEQKFKCPCHGSGFYISGINFEGPAPRPLERAGISIAPDGMLEVDKSLKFQEEMGQWADGNSYVPVV